MPIVWILLIELRTQQCERGVSTGLLKRALELAPGAVADLLRRVVGK